MLRYVALCLLDVSTTCLHSAAEFFPKKLVLWRERSVKQFSPIGGGSTPQKHIMNRPHAVIPVYVFSLSTVTNQTLTAWLHYSRVKEENMFHLREPIVRGHLSSMSATIIRPARCSYCTTFCKTSKPRPCCEHTHV